MIIVALIIITMLMIVCWKPAPVPVGRTAAADLRRQPRFSFSSSGFGIHYFSRLKHVTTCIYICFCLYVCISLYIYIYISMYIYIYIYIYMAYTNLFGFICFFPTPASDSPRRRRGCRRAPSVRRGPVDLH